MYCNIFKEDFDGIPLISLTEEFNVWNLEPEPKFPARAYLPIFKTGIRK